MSDALGGVPGAEWMGYLSWAPGQTATVTQHNFQAEHGVGMEEVDAGRRVFKGSKGLHHRALFEWSIGPYIQSKTGSFSKGQ